MNDTEYFSPEQTENFLSKRAEEHAKKFAQNIIANQVKSSSEEVYV